MLNLDISLFYFINHSNSNKIFDIIMPFITKKGYILLLPYLFYILHKASVSKKRGHDSFNITFVAWGLLISASAFLISDWLGYELKNFIKRTRPCNVLEDVRLLVGCSRSYSMPSNHAANSMAVATSLLFLNRKYIGKFLSFYPIFLAILISYSRVYVGVHYPSDVLVGMILGSLVSFFTISFFRYASILFKKNPYKTVLYAFLFILSIFRIYYILHGPIDLSPDEAHYWEWSRRPDFSYYSKGPMIAYLILLGTSLLGDNIVGIRLMAVIFSSLSSILLFKLVMAMNKNPEHQELYSSRALLSAILLQIIPLFSPFGVIFTIDPPFVFFWILSLYLFWKAIDEGSFLRWGILGISIGLGLITKYTMAFFLICSFLFLIFSNKRYLLRTPMPYLSLALSSILFSPVIFWNYKHEWVTLKHTAGQAHLSTGLSINFQTFLEFIASQIGVITPLIFFMMFYAIIKIKKEEGIKPAFLFYFSIPIIAFFILKSLHAKVQANWAMTGYITAIIAFSIFYLKSDSSIKGLFRFKRPKLTIISIALPIFITVLAHYPSIINLPTKLDPTSRLKGWKDLGEEVTKIYEELPKESHILLFSDRYQVSSELAFYVKGHPRTYCINNGRRMNQYDLWPDMNSDVDRIKALNRNIQINGIYVRTGNSEIPLSVKDAFSSCEKRLFRAFDKGKRLIREYSIFICYNFKGLKNPKPEKF